MTVRSVVCLLCLATLCGRSTARTFSQSLVRAADPHSRQLLTDKEWMSYKPPGSRSFFEQTYPRRLEDVCEPGSCEHQRPDEYPAEASPSNGLLYIKVNGGLNQQRRGIVNGVAVARVLNATLVVPELVLHHFWRDNSSFEDIYEVDHFMKAVQGDVRMVRALTAEQEEFIQNHRRKILVQIHTEVPPEWYLEHVLPILKRYGMAVFPAFHRQLAHKIDPALQRVRCRTNYHALQFAIPIRSAGEDAVQAIKARGPYVAVHLRVEPDWVRHKGCHITSQNWLMRDHSSCLITPVELAVILKAFGVDSSTTIYIATGNKTEGVEAFAALYEAFPGRIADKYSLLGGRVDDFAPYANKMAAIDQMVCEQSDFLLLTAGSNFASILRGQRFYHNVSQESLQLSTKDLTPLFSQSSIDMDVLREKLERRRETLQREELLGSLRTRGFFERPWECVCKTIPKAYLHKSYRRVSLLRLMRRT